jgi:hypothetical protein
MEAIAGYPLGKVEEEVQVEGEENKDCFIIGVGYRGGSQADFRLSFQYKYWENFDGRGRR